MHDQEISKRVVPEGSSNRSASRLQPSASYSFTMRLHLPQQGGAFARIAGAIADTGATLGAIDLVRVESELVVRDVTVACIDAAHAETVVGAVRELEGVRVDSVSDRTFLMHKGGKIEILEGADLLLGVSGPRAVSPAAIRRMAPGAIVFAMANPVPEVHPEEVRFQPPSRRIGRARGGRRRRRHGRGAA